MTSVTVVRRNPGGVDEYGDPIGSTETRTDIPGAFVAPVQSEEVDDNGRAGVAIGWTLYVPHGTDLTHVDAVEVGGVTYEVEGNRGDWLHPMTGWKAGATVALRRVEG